MSRRSSKAARKPSRPASPSTAADAALDGGRADASRVAELAAVLASPDWQARRDAVARAGGLLQGLPAPDVVDGVAELLGQVAALDPKHEVRGEVARVAGSLYHPRFAQIVGLLSGDSHHQVARAALATLGRRTQHEAHERDREERAHDVEGGLTELAALHRPEVVTRLEAALRGRAAEIATTAVHDVNHLLTAIHNALEELGEGLQARQVPGEVWDPTHAQIKTWLARTREIVGLQIAFAQAAPEPERVVVLGAVREAIEAARRQLGPHPSRTLVKVQEQVGRHLACEVPRSSFVRALTNVVANALHVIEGSGTIRVNAAITPDAELALLVEDTGPGLPDKARRTLLTGLAVKRRGSELHGWGLSSAHQCVVVHCRGRIEVAPRSGGGTAIHFFLPIERREEVPE